MLERFTNFKISVKDVKKKKSYLPQVLRQTCKNMSTVIKIMSQFSLMYVWAKQGPTRKRSGTLKLMLIK